MCKSENNNGDQTEKKKSPNILKNVHSDWAKVQNGIPQSLYRSFTAALFCLLMISVQWFAESDLGNFVETLKTVYLES